jgi:hypothetical protein
MRSHEFPRALLFLQANNSTNSPHASSVTAIITKSTSGHNTKRVVDISGSRSDKYEDDFWDIALRSQLETD